VSGVNERKRRWKEKRETVDENYFLFFISFVIAIIILQAL